ncbi:thioesterase family protein [Tessaracoccus massiliensis]|uniref:thioesterase family protein n=1 Tax=Tessaracoccus massiliensis TaxID=1522311 RepID=UPI0024829CF7|nr:thioesterase family protein [Tessaracoccus massiliensis]
MRAGMWQKISERGWYPVVAGQTITYRKSLQPFQKFDLYTRLVGYDGPWVYVEQTFCVGETVYAHAVVRARFLKRTGGTVDAADVAALSGEDHNGEIPQWMRDWTVATKPVRDYRPDNVV